MRKYILTVLIMTGLISAVSEGAQINAPKLSEKVIIYSKKTAPTVEAQAQAKVKAQVKAKAEAKTEARAKIGISEDSKNLKDPFQVDFQLMKKGETVESAELIEKKTFTLQGMIVGASRSVALVDDNVLELGDYIYGWKLIGVKKDRVGFKKGSEIKKLYLNLGGVSNGK